MYLGKKKERIIKEDAIFEQKSNFFFEDDLFIELERKIIKTYFLAGIYFLIFFRKICYIIYIIILFFYIFLHFNIDYNVLIFSLLFLVLVAVSYVLIYFVNYVIYSFEFVFYYYLKNNRVSKLSLDIKKFFLTFIVVFVKLIIIGIFKIKSIWKHEIFYFIYFLMKKYIFYFIFFFKFFIFKLAYNILAFFYFSYSIFLYLNRYMVIFIFFFLTKKKNTFYLNYKKIKFFFVNILKIKNNLFLNLYIRLKIKKILTVSLKYFIRFVVFLNFIFELLFFFNKFKIFTDRFIFYVWEDVRDDDFEYTFWTVNYKFTKLYSECSYFSLKGYIYWMLHVWKYRIVIPVSFYINKWEWELELYEIYTFNLIEYTEVEKTIIYFYNQMSYFFLQENSMLNCKNLFLDFYNYIWFFIIEDLFLYYTQCSLIIQYCFVYLKLQIFAYYKKLKYIYFLIFFFFYNINFLKLFNFIKLSNFIKYIYLFFGFLKISIIFIVLKFLKICKKYNKIRKFIFLKKEHSLMWKLILLFFYMFFSLYFFIKNIKNFQVYNFYFVGNKIKLNYFYKLFVNPNKFLKIDYRLAKHYKKDEYFLFFRRFFFFKSPEIVLWAYQEKKELYDILKKELSKYKNLKSVDKITWYDRLTGANIGYIRTNKIYKYYLKLKYAHWQKKVNKFEKKKNEYFFLLKKKKK